MIRFYLTYSTLLVNIEFELGLKITMLKSMLNEIRIKN